MLQVMAFIAQSPEFRTGHLDSYLLLTLTHDSLRTGAAFSVCFLPGYFTDVGCVALQHYHCYRTVYFVFVFSGNPFFWETASAVAF